jgi:hypothetical protein
MYASLSLGIRPCHLPSLHTRPYPLPTQLNIFSEFYWGLFNGRAIERFPIHICDGTHSLAKIGLYNYELEQHWFGLHDVFYCGSTVCNDNALNFAMYM